MKRIKLSDTTLIGSWEEVSEVQSSDFTRNESDLAMLNGLILRGYETQFANGVNANGEQYTKDSIDDFVQRYFVDKKLNMPVDIEHDHRPEWLAGRVLYLETNDTGFYFVIYIPNTFIHYETVRNLLREGILQGFSKEGYAQGEMERSEDGTPFFKISKMDIFRVSIVSTPANYTKFEKMQETRNELKFNSNKYVPESFHDTHKSFFRPRYNPYKKRNYDF